MDRSVVVATDELGPDLDETQTKIVTLFVQDGLSHEKIAKAVGYSQQQSVSRFLSSARGRAGVEWAMRRYMVMAGAIGLRSMVKLATSAKSENVRQMAAADLLNRARVGMDGETGGNGHRSQGGVTIVIGGMSLDAGSPVMVDVSPQDHSTMED